MKPSRGQGACAIERLGAKSAVSETFAKMFWLNPPGPQLPPWNKDPMIVASFSPGREGQGGHQKILCLEKGMAGARAKSGYGAKEGA